MTESQGGGWLDRLGVLVRPGLRAEDFVARIPTDGPVLEIGPFVRPRLSGPQVRYFDLADRAALNARARRKGMAETAPEIDFVSPDGDLSIVPGPFAALFSAHCIEHELDLVAHLEQAARLLEPHGRYFLVVPDKRYCMDHFLPASTIAGVLDAHLRPTARHTPRSVVEHRALTTHNSPRRHWRGDHGSADVDPGRLKTALAEAGSERASDVHAWTFTPDSFARTVDALLGAGLTAMAVEKVWPTAFGRGEFCAVLRRAD